MTIIYGLRERGSIEIRYVGMTDYPLELRLKKHLQDARKPYRAAMRWVADCAEVEIVVLCNCPSEQARVEERRMVGAFHAAGHRLLNGHLRPRKAAEVLRTSELKPGLSFARAA